MNTTAGPYEFGSQEWIEHAWRYLEREVPALVGPAAEVEFDLCEIYTDPPPHLSADGAPIAWWFRIDKGRVDFGRGFRDDVVNRVELDYDATLPIARSVYTDDADAAAEIAAQRARERAEAEARGESAIVVPTEIHELLRGLHDHIARATK